MKKSPTTCPNFWNTTEGVSAGLFLLALAALAVGVVLAIIF